MFGVLRCLIESGRAVTDENGGRQLTKRFADSVDAGDFAEADFGGAVLMPDGGLDRRMAFQIDGLAVQFRFDDKVTALDGESYDDGTVFVRKDDDVFAADEFKMAFQKARQFRRDVFAADSDGGLKAFRAARMSSLSGASCICLAISKRVFFEPSWKT